MKKELAQAYKAVASTWGSREQDGSQIKLNAFTEKLLEYLPDIDADIRSKCILASYLLVLDELGKIPSPKEIKDGLSKIVHDCKNMASSFDSMNPYILYFLQRGFSFDQSKPINVRPFSLVNFVDFFQAFTERISAYSENYINRSPSKGPHKESAVDQFILQLATAYEKTTDKLAKHGVTADANHKAFHGVFFDMVLACSNALGKKYHSNDALGQRIRRVLNKRKKRI